MSFQAVTFVGIARTVTFHSQYMEAKKFIEGTITAGECLGANVQGSIWRELLSGRNVKIATYQTGMGWTEGLTIQELMR